MGIKRLINYTVVPAAIGAAAGFAAQKMGYDISAVEGMKQAVMAGLPAAALFSSSSQESMDEAYKFCGKHPYTVPALAAGLMAGLYALGGLGMEWLSESDISQGFTSAVGGLEGAVSGMLASTVGRLKNRE
jgi:hypothetical protein